MCPSRGNYPSSSYSGHSEDYSYYDDSYYDTSSYGRRRHYPRDTRHYEDYQDRHDYRRRRSPIYDEYRDHGPSYRDPYVDSNTDHYRRYTPPPRRDYHDEHQRRSDRSRSPRPRRSSPSYDPNRRDRPLPSRRSPTPPAPRRTEPTEDYNQTSSQPPAPLSDPTSSPKLLVLDLNGTLVLRGDRRQAQNHRFSNPKTCPRSGPPPPPPPPTLRAVYPRPYLGTFKDFIFHPETKKWLDVMVWSSAQPHSVADMVEKCFDGRRKELKDVWARDTLGLTHAEYNQKTQTTKDLDKIWKEVSFTESGIQAATVTVEHEPSRRHSSKTTLLMDDSPLKAILQPWNHLCIPEYDAETRKRDVAAAEALHNQRRRALENAQAQLDAMKEIVEAGPVVEDGMTEKAAKRKLKKQKKLLKRMEEKASSLADDESRAAEYEEEEDAMPRVDETLLAVIGILDTIKLEENVAAWMKCGGLVDSVVAEEADESQGASERRNCKASPSSVASPSSSLSISSDEPLNNNNNNKPPQSPSANEFPPSSQVVDSEMGLNLDQTSSPPLDDEERREQESTGVPIVEGANGPLWFQDPSTLAFWANRGREACEVLEIPVKTGL